MVKIPVPDTEQAMDVRCCYTKYNSGEITVKTFYNTVTIPIFVPQKQESMRKLLFISMLASGAVFMANCTPKASKAIAELPVESKEQITAKYSPQQLESGKTIFTGNCAKCHKLKEPGTRTPEQWNKVLKRMIPKAKLSDEDGMLVRAYLIAHAKG